MHLDLQFSVLISRWLPYIAPMPPMHPPWAPPWPLLEEPPHTSLYSLYQLADLTHCSLPCHVFCRWTTGVPTNFLNSEKTKIMNNFELKPGKYIPAHLLQTSIAAKLQNHEALCALLTCLFFFSRWIWNQRSSLKIILAALKLSPCKHISSTLDWLIGCFGILLRWDILIFVKPKKAKVFIDFSNRLCDPLGNKTI